MIAVDFLSGIWALEVSLAEKFEMFEVGFVNLLVCEPLSKRGY